MKKLIVLAVLLSILFTGLWMGIVVILPTSSQIKTSTYIITSPFITTKITEKSEITAIKKRCRFSESFLKEFPNIYADLTIQKNKFTIFKQIISSKPAVGSYKDIVTNRDIVNLIGEIMSEGIDKLNPLDKRTIITVIGGYSICITYGHVGGYYVGWNSKIPEAVPYLIELLNDKESMIRGLSAILLVEFNMKNRIPKEVVKDIMHIALFGTEYWSYKDGRCVYATMEKGFDRARAAIEELGGDVEEVPEPNPEIK